MLMEANAFKEHDGIMELDTDEVTAISGGVVPAYLGVRIAAAVGTIAVLAAIDYFSED